METRIRYDFKTAFVMATGTEEARALIGTYIGVPNGEPDRFDLYRMDADGQPIGECQGQMGSTILETMPIEKK